MNLDLICMKFWMHRTGPLPASPRGSSYCWIAKNPEFPHPSARLLFLVSGPSIAALHQAFSLKFLKPAA